MLLKKVQAINSVIMSFSRLCIMEGFYSRIFHFPLSFLTHYYLLLPFNTPWKYKKLSDGFLMFSGGVYRGDTMLDRLIRVFN